MGGRKSLTWNETKLRRVFSCIIHVILVFWSWKQLNSFYQPLSLVHIHKCTGDIIDYLPQRIEKARPYRSRMDGNLLLWLVSSLPRSYGGLYQYLRPINGAILVFVMHEFFSGGGDRKALLKYFIQYLEKCSLQDWNNTHANSSKLSFYSQFKSMLEPESISRSL